MAVAASLKEGEAQTETLRGELKTGTDRGEVASRQLGEARKTNEKHETARAELTTARDELARARAASENDLHKTRGALDAARADATLAAKKYEKIAADNTRLDESISVAHSQSEASEAKLAAVTDLFKQSAARVKVFEKAQQDHEPVVRDMESRVKDKPAAAAPSGAPLAMLDHLLPGFQAPGEPTDVTAMR